MAEESILLKWGTLKAWNLGENEAAIDAAKRYFSEGVCMSAMSQKDTETQKRALCDIIDAINGEIQNDWTGEMMTKDEAKKYVMEYGK